MVARWLVLVLMLPMAAWCAAAGVWHDAEAQYRRGLTIEMPPEKITAEQLVSARLLLNGKQLEGAADLRVLTEQGKPVTYRVLAGGPGDRVEVLFNAAAGVRDYHAYFGAKSARKPPAGTLNKGGLVFELRSGAAGGANDAEALKQAFSRGGKMVGQRTIGRVHLGNNLLGHEAASLTRISGNLFVPLEGNYLLAVAADDRAALFIDGEPAVFARHPSGDARFQARVKLTRGWHPFEMYQTDLGGDYRLGLYWQRPDTDKLDVIGSESFGQLVQASVQPLEVQGQTVAADLQATYLGESFYADRFSHRYRFDVASTIKNTERLQVKWKFEDGRTVTGTQFEHVFMNSGVHDVEVEVKAGANSDTQKYRLHVTRDFERADQPAVDELGLHARLVASYNFAELKSETLAHAVMMFLRSSQVDQAYRAGKALVALKSHPNRPLAQQAVTELREHAMEQGRPERVMEVYDAAHRESELNPALAVEHAMMLMYAQGEFAKGRDVVAPLGAKDHAARRVEAQAVLLLGDLAKAQRMLNELPVSASQQKREALSGAMARTTEFHIREKNVEAAEESWQKWMATFPADFLDGNAALLRVQLNVAQKRPAVAAKVAEAYANGHPQSAYAPRLLHEAAKILEGSDENKAGELRSLLKQRYPEDPLSQGL